MFSQISSDNVALMNGPTSNCTSPSVVPIPADIPLVARLLEVPEDGAFSGEPRSALVPARPCLTGLDLRRVVRLTTGPLELWLVDCEQDEQALLKALDAALLSQLVCRLASYVGREWPREPIHVVCLGRFNRLSARTLAACNMSSGLIELPLAGYAGTSRLLMRVLCHEVAHSVMAVSAHPYRYPVPIEEAVAYAMELRFGEYGIPESRRLVLTNVPRGDGLQGWRPGTSLESVIFGDWSADTRDGYLHRCAYRLLRLLADVNHRSGAYSGLLQKLRADAVSQAGLHDWLTAKWPFAHTTLEAAFEQYCSQGRSP